jgi:hypothetical protein
MASDGRHVRRPCIRGSILGASLLLAWDAAWTGSFLMSLLVCPVWFLVSVVKNAVEQPGWSIVIIRTAIPVLTLGLVLGNNALQLSRARGNAHRIIDACEQFHATNGKYPTKLDELVPRYLNAVPRAKYCVVWGEFMYIGSDHHTGGESTTLSAGVAATSISGSPAFPPPSSLLCWRE